MGEAYLMGGGGMRLRSLEVTQQPDKILYLSGQNADLTGAKIRALFARDAITLTPDNYSYSPSGALAVTDEAIIVTSTIGGVTRAASIPITVLDFNATLNLNGWDMIALASSDGIAKDLWSVGDTKTDTVNGVEYTFKIIAFDADPLDTTDAKYNDASYNGGKKKAGITFQVFTCPSAGKMHNSSADAGWDDCSMRKTLLKNLYNSFPAGLRGVIRTVKKYTMHGYYYNKSGKTNAFYTADTLFIPAVKEIHSGSGLSQYMTQEGNNVPFYTYYQNGATPPDNSWTRSSDSPSCGVENHYAYHSSNKAFGLDSGAQSNRYYYPIFNI